MCVRVRVRVSVSVSTCTCVSVGVRVSLSASACECEHVRVRMCAGASVPVLLSGATRGPRALRTSTPRSRGLRTSAVPSGLPVCPRLSSAFPSRAGGSPANELPGLHTSGPASGTHALPSPVLRRDLGALARPLPPTGASGLNHRDWLLPEREGCGEPSRPLCAGEGGEGPRRVPTWARDGSRGASPSTFNRKQTGPVCLGKTPYFRIARHLCVFFEARPGDC